MKKTTKFGSFLAFVLAFVFIFSPMFLLAQNNGGNSPPPTGNPPGGGNSPPPPTTISINIPNPLKVDTIYEFIRLVIDNIVLPIGGVLAVLYIMYAGFLMVTARGDEAQIKKGRAAFLHAAIGTAILLGAWVIAIVIENTINSLRTG